ncbi:MAG: phosphoenolpyruvate--protein phosphotransferase, partial [Clostridia bacterium]|nr:phosphoenolpyruvate--protein phosphotransferase [Clostridia bacterium]
MLQGIGASQGYGIGKAVIIEDLSLDYSAVKYSSAEEEKARLQKAMEDFTTETKEMVEKLKSSAGEKEAAILEGHLTMLEDPFMQSQMSDNIDAGMTAEASADTVCTMFYEMFAGVDDEMMRQRASDIKDIKDSLLRLLLGLNNIDISAVPKDSILIAKDFTPSMTSQINKENVAAIVTEVGGVTSHSAILARAMGIPAALSVLNATTAISDGDSLIVDGFKGKVYTSPTKEEVAEFAEKQKAYLEDKEGLKVYFGKPSVTKSGVVKKVYGNIGKAEDA